MNTEFQAYNGRGDGEFERDYGELQGSSFEHVIAQIQERWEVDDIKQIFIVDVEAGEARLFDVVPQPGFALAQVA